MYNQLRIAAKKALNTINWLLLTPAFCRPKRSIKKEKIRKILVINLQGIGDILMTTPLLRTLKESYKDARIDICAYNKNATIIENMQFINNIIERKQSDLVSIDFLQTLKTIRKTKYDLVINAFPAQHSALLAILSGALYIVGNLHGTKATTNNLKHKEANKTRDLRVNNQEIAKILDIKIKEPTTLSITIKRTQETAIKKQYKKPYIIINPNANWFTKKWPATRWQGIIEWLLKTYKKKIVLITTSKDKDYTTHIVALCRNSKNITIHESTNIHNLAALVKNADLMVTTDTGPMHIAIATKTKTVALFGVTDPQKLVSGIPHLEAVNAYNTCPRKFQFNHNNEPIDPNRVCMKKITIKQVQDAISKVHK